MQYSETEGVLFVMLYNVNKKNRSLFVNSMYVFCVIKCPDFSYLPSTCRVWTVSMLQFPESFAQLMLDAETNNA